MDTSPAFIVTWLVLYAIQVPPTSLLVKRGVKRDMSDGVSLFLLIVALPATSYVGATWIANKYF
jgi:uncharacterized membrane protein YhaH (DUF805 family)